MAMAEDFVNDDQRDGTITEAEAQIEATLFKQGQEYAARNQRSKAENKGRAEGRAKIKELGMNPSAYAQAIKLIKDLTPAELKDWKRDFELTLKVMGSKQRELFPDEQLAAEARIQRAKDKAAGKPRGKDELDAKTDTDPKSDPAAGGAQVDIEQAIAEATAKEQADGEALLEGKSGAWRMGFNAAAAKAERGSSPYLEGSAEERDWLAGYEAETKRAFDAATPPEPPAEEPAAPAPKAKPKSQSQKAADKARAAGLN